MHQFELFTHLIQLNIRLTVKPNLSPCLCIENISSLSSPAIMKRTSIEVHRRICRIRNFRACFFFLQFWSEWLKNNVTVYLRRILIAKQQADSLLCCIYMRKHNTHLFTLLEEQEQCLICVIAHYGAGSARQHYWAQDCYCPDR